MFKLKLIFLSFLILFCSGCVSLPFKSIDYAPLGDINPAAWRAQFQASLPAELELINSIVFQYKWRSFSALGYTYLDLVNNTFRVSCMNPVGIKLFELTGGRGKIEANFVLKELLQQGDLPRAVGEDIRRVYFDMLPALEAKVEKQKNKVIFSQPFDDGTMKYVFGGSRHLLTEKHYFEKNRRLWSVYYYEFQEHQGKLYPSGILLKHHRFGYNLIIRLKEVRKNE